MSGLPVSALPWGSDVLGLGGGDAVREIDLLRVGRQPQIWRDDVMSAHDSAKHDVAFHGRPPATEGDYHISELFAWYRRTKFVLASSNLVCTASYVHRTEEYITGRWTDGLAGGAVIAGRPPLSDRTCTEVLWPEAFLDLPITNRREGLEVIADAVHRWTPELAQHNYQMSLQRLDWRHRFAEIAEFFSLTAPVLDRSLSEISKLRHV
ncbi:MAG: hypothetical protein AAGF79_00770 [Pseudomonadota bacterium]